MTILGDDRDKVVVFYANNEVFNPHPSNISTNEWPGTFPSRRAAFMGDNSTVTSPSSGRVTRCR